MLVASLYFFKLEYIIKINIFLNFNILLDKIY
jgi:hypothetical protein